MGPPRKILRGLLHSWKLCLGAIEVLALEAPVDAVYGAIRASLERTGQPIGANDLLIAAHALAWTSQS